MFHLTDLDFPRRLAITMFLVVLGSGYLVSVFYLKTSSEMADGKPGLGLDDITVQFHGSSLSSLAQQVQGPMKKYFREDQDESKLTAKELADIKKIVDWCAAGAAKEGYEDADKEKNKTLVGNIIFKYGCTDCHAPDATMKGAKPEIPLDTFEHVSKYTKPSTGMDLNRLLSLSHVHLLGMGMMFFLLGAFVSLTRFGSGLKALLIFCGPLSVLLDIFGWWGVKFYGAPFSPVVMGGGALMGCTFFASAVVVLYDLWIRKAPAASGN